MITYPIFVHWSSILFTLLLSVIMSFIIFTAEAAYMTYEIILHVYTSQPLLWLKFNEDSIYRICLIPHFPKDWHSEEVNILHSEDVHGTQWKKWLCLYLLSFGELGDLVLNYYSVLQLVDLVQKLLPKKEIAACLLLLCVSCISYGS